MTERTRKKLKIASSLTLALLSLFSAVTLTFSWFSHNRKVDGGDMGITVGQEEKAYVDHTFYRVDSTDGGAGTLFVGMEKQSASLGTYDILKQEYQRILKIYVKDTVTALNISAVTDTRYFLGNPNKRYLLKGPDPTDPSVPNDNNGQDEWTNSLASVVGLTLLSPSSLTKEIKNGETAYRIASLPEDNLHTFIDKNNITETTVPQNFTLTAEGEYLGEETVTDGEGNTTTYKVAYLLLSYDRSLISTVCSVNIGNPALQKEDGTAQTIPFRADFRLELLAK